MNPKLIELKRKIDKYAIIVRDKTSPNNLINQTENQQEYRTLEYHQPTGFNKDLLNTPSYNN